MAKRILAIVMVLVLGLSLLTVEMFAADGSEAKLQYVGGTLTLTWTENSEATKYVASIKNASGKEVASKTVSVTDKTTAEDFVLSKKSPAGGTYYGEVEVYNGTKRIDWMQSDEQFVPSSSTGTGSVKITVTGSTANKVDVTWTGKSGVSSYYYEYTYLKDGKSSNGSGYVTVTGEGALKFSVPLDISYENLRSFKIYVGTDKDHESSSSGTWTNTGVVDDGSSNAGDVWFVEETLFWAVNNDYYYTVAIKINNSVDLGEVGHTTNKGVNKADMTSAIARFRNTYGSSVVLTFYVYGGTSLNPATTSANLVGYVTYNGNYSGGSNNDTTTDNGVIKSDGCNLTVGSTTTTVKWSAVSKATRYLVVYNVDGSNEGKLVTATGTSATISVGYSNCNTGFTVNVYPVDNNNNSVSNTVLSATYTRRTTTTPTTSTTTGLTLTEKTAATTAVSWEPVSGAVYYRISYGIFTSDSVVTMTPTTATSVVIPLGRRTGFMVYVDAYTSSGRAVRVGQATHVGGDPYPAAGSTNTDKPAADNTSVYVTGFKGATGNDKITLSWNAAKNATTYTVYWKRSSASEWKKAGSTSKRAVNITGLHNGIAYDFKVVANGYESGILKEISPSASGSTTKVAPDPAGAGTATTVPVITSASGGKGTITLSWSAITNGKEYQVWVAKSGSSEYTLVKSGITGTSVTITGLSAGTYKVRVKGTTDGNYKKFTEGGGSDYRSVTVS